MALDDVTAGELRKARRRALIVASVGVVVVCGFIVAASVDPDRFAPAIDADQSSAWAAIATIALVACVSAFLFAMIGLARVRRQRRTVLQSPFRRVTARWAPGTTRGQSVPGLAFEAPDGSWLGLHLAGTVRSAPLEARVREAGAVDVAYGSGYAVVRAPGSTALLSAKPKGSVPEPAPSGSSTLLVTLRGGAPIAIAPGAGDAGAWFRESTRLPTGEIIRSLLFFGLVTVSIGRSWFDGRADSVGGVIVSAFAFAAASLAIALLLLTRTVTTVDRGGLRRKPFGRRPKYFPFDRITIVQRYATATPTGPAKIVVTLDDASSVTISTRQPDDLIAALRRGRAFS